MSLPLLASFLRKASHPKATPADMLPTPVPSPPPSPMIAPPFLWFPIKTDPPVACSDASSLSPPPKRKKKTRKYPKHPPRLCLQGRRENLGKNEQQASKIFFRAGFIQLGTLILKREKGRLGVPQGPYPWETSSGANHASLSLSLPLPGPERGVITENVFSLEESLESWKSLNSQNNSWFVFHTSWAL